MSSDADAASLLAAVYADPASDAARSVYADFLQERGERHGHFISAQLSGDIEGAVEHVREAMRASPLPFYRELNELPIPKGATWQTDVRLRGFDRGFLRATSIQGDARALIDADGWELIEYLTIATADAGNFVAGIAGRLKSLRHFDVQDWRAAEALAHFRPKPLRFLRVRGLAEWFDLTPLIDAKTTVNVELFGLLDLWRVKRDGAWTIELEILYRAPQTPNAPLERALRALIPPKTRTTFTYRFGGHPLIEPVRAMLARLDIVAEERPVMVMG